MHQRTKHRPTARQDWCTHQLVNGAAQSCIIGFCSYQLASLELLFQHQKAFWGKSHPPEVHAQMPSDYKLWRYNSGIRLPTALARSYRASSSVYMRNDRLHPSVYTLIRLKYLALHQHQWHLWGPVEAGACDSVTGVAAS